MNTAHELRAVAVAAQCDPRTVRKVLDGENVRPMTRARIIEAAKKLGLKVPRANG